MSVFKSRFLFILFLFVVLLFAFSCAKTDSKNVKYIAYIGRYSDIKDTAATPKESKFDKLHEVALQQYIGQLDLPYTRLELKTFDCQKDGSISAAVYDSIAADTNIVVVIDNSWGQEIKFCTSAIKDKNIPVISINADRNNCDFGTNAIFTGNNDNVPLDIAAFVHKILKVNKVNFISEEDYPLHDNYLKVFKKKGIQLNKMFTLKGKSFASQDSANFYNELSTFFSNNPEEEGTQLVINVHVGVGNQLIDYLDRNFSHLKILGHTYILNPSHVKKFGDKNKNELIIISSPTDALSQQLTADIDHLKETYPQYLENPNHPMFIQRCYDAVEIIKNKFQYQNDTFALHKSDFIDYFHSLKNSSIVTETKIYEFDSLLTIIPELYFTEYSSGKLNSYPLQLNKEREVIPNLFFGMEIVDIYNIDVNSNSFTSDFYYWIKLDSNNRDAEKFIIFQNMKQNESSQELVFEKTDGSTVYKLYKVSGIFYVNCQLKEYPFDEQELFIRAEILSPSNNLKVSFDQKSFSLDKKTIDKFKITEWEKSRYYVTVDNEISMGMHGDPDINQEELNEFKNIYFRLDVARNPTGPLLEIILPLLLIGLISLSLLFMRDITFDALGEVSIGVFMAIVAFSISFSASTPKSNELTKADLLFWLTFVVVFVNFMIVIVINALYKVDKVREMNIRRVIFILGIFYFILVWWFLVK
ncbi:MAG: hypothetical protein NT150_00120 [Bacteroidetes bacterium]|nr:hypothetical protein [Bacteroidota bacterium]